MTKTSRGFSYGTCSHPLRRYPPRLTQTRQGPSSSAFVIDLEEYYAINRCWSLS